ncbi:hypothetical protein PILCRDRAFT_15634 [Piloderma croceum F 1598]|uniref:Uncharacterized protein n=1 Tax=Piloderma croceum (strain F 1598) TaxID=765440 RepID=A0A0C3B6L7_PILCF|nr:hypothetical protein PILCRDRAFT_15634 [Piloderma croceum F 1598]
MKRVNYQLHADSNAPTNTMDAFLHAQKRVRHANTQCLTVSRDVDSHKGRSEMKGAQDCLEKMEIDHNHVEDLAVMDFDSTTVKGSMSLAESYLLRSIPDLGQHSIISITVVCGDLFSCERLVSVSDIYDDANMPDLVWLE